MKKTIICGVASLAMIATPTSSAFAAIGPVIMPGMQSLIGMREATVGEVDETIYSVDMDWGNMIFDWKYDSATNEFNFESHDYDLCQAVSVIPDGKPRLESLRDKGLLFSDSSCTEVYNGEIAEVDSSDSEGQTIYYYQGIKNNRIEIYDESVNGRITPTVSFTSQSKYSWVSGVFGHETSLGQDSFVEDENGVLSFDSSTRTHSTELKLVKNSEATISSDLVTADDVIGTVNVLIEPDLN